MIRSILPLLLLALAACGARAPQAGRGELKCGTPATAIADVQGGGGRSARIDQVVEVEGVVVASYPEGPRGYYLQSPAATPADAARAVFVTQDAALPAVGSSLRVRGTVRALGEPNAAVTAIAGGTVRRCADGPLPQPVVLAQQPADWSRYEGMRVALPGPLTVTGNGLLLWQGALDVSFGGRLVHATERHAPGAEAAALAAANAAAHLRLDDGRDTEYPDKLWILGKSPLSTRAPWRTGSVVRDVAGVLDLRNGQRRLQLTAAIGAVEQAPRPKQPPEVRGDLHVAGFNLLNLFNGDGAGGGFPTPRGATDAAELARQTDKLVGAVAAIAPDAAALMEVENDGYGEESTIAGFVRALNARLGEKGDYAYVAREAPGVGADQIGVAMIYRTSTLKPLGAPAVLETGAFAAGNRVPLAQALAPVDGGDPFVLVAMHLKSKRCSDVDAANADHGDGQGCWNALRAQAARELADWLATDPTAQGAGAQTLVVGDLNSYGEEDPVRVLRDAGFVDVVARAIGQDAYSFVYDGDSGRLDHALATNALAARVVGAAEWHVNADESDAFDYDVEHKESAERARWYQAGPFRSSDHDPLIVGLKR
ncbi:MAG TPA: ExeM/NucH family extracellular endonuclease [Xanthomonadales bacterium]|nr:ExeM/NucH family extracellular endonuclease [Xanthomonadales bacterium]